MTVDDGDGVGVSPDGPDFEVVDRRRLVFGGLVAAAGAAVVASIAEPAAAANGGPVVLGVGNAASATTAISTTSGHGFQAKTSASSKVGLRGLDTSASGGGFGVWGQSNKGTGVHGRTAGAGYSAVLGVNTNAGTPGFGVRGVTTKGTGVRGETSDVNGAGVQGIFLGNSGAGVRGEGSGAFGYGVIGSAPGAFSYGVFGSAPGDFSYGVAGSAPGPFGVGVYGAAPGTFGYAGQFNGDVQVSGTLSKGGGSFRIDHPLDPANKFLSHSFVESPDMKNIYDGVAVLDDDGQATVEMADWFEALNRDFRYQLTALDAPAPDLHIASRIKDGSFTIAGGAPGQEVSWTVTGIRQDAWANANRIPIEEDKTKDERGKYLHPKVAKGVKNAKPLLTGPKTPPKSTVALDLPVR